MFTGIVEDLGSVSFINNSKMVVDTRLSGISKGDSISVNGVCLTVTEIKGAGKAVSVSFDYTPETSGRTTLDTLKTGSVVNLEPALKADSRLVGHFVMGHVEGACEISAIKRAGNSFVFSFKVDKGLSKYIVPKGSVALDGISLTVADCSDKDFSVSVVPHTFENTNLKFKKPGGLVNIETDILARHLEKLAQNKGDKRITEDFLKENGFH